MDSKIKTSGSGKYKVEQHVLQGDNGTSGKGVWDAGTVEEGRYQIQSGAGW